MKVIKFSVSLLVTLGLIYFLNNSWTIGGKPIPPPGKFLDPFHGFWQNIESENNSATIDLTIEGLQAPVSVRFDSLMIPHIFAQNDADLYLAQGYVTAMHRLWQMEFQTHAAAGRISEILATDDILNYDRAQRRLGMVYGARRALQAMEEDPTTALMMAKYTEGINQYIQGLSYDELPFEYKLLDYKPEPWTALKCALLLKNMAQTLDMGDKDMEMTNALKLFGKETVDLLYPDQEGVGDPIVDNPGGWKFNPIRIDTVALAMPTELIKLKKLPGSDPTTGSNNWAVSGSKTATGSPMLCGDPHLRLSLPSIWYAIQLNAPGVNSMGVSLPGSPAIIIGFNDSIAWSVTNAQRDLVDWFKITFDGENREKYLLDGKWIPTEKVVEEIKVRGNPTFYDTVRYTYWGPITYDESFRAENNHNGYAFRWIAHEKSNEALTFHKLNRAKNHSDYMEALNVFYLPAQNFVFASVSGDIAMRIQGRFPVRRPEEGKFVLDGSQSSFGWQAFIPNEQNVMSKNPARGFVSSANQMPVDPTYPYYYTATSYEAYRNRRINQVLSQTQAIQVNDLMKLQNDNYNLKAAESLPAFLHMLDSVHLKGAELTAYSILKSWDYYNNAESEGASYYEAWWDSLMPLIWDELEKEGMALSRPTTYNTIKLIKEKPDLSFFDIQGTPEKETAGDVVRKAFSVAIEGIEKWKQENAATVKWADYKDSFIGHLLPPMRALSIPVKTGGNHDIVNAHSRTHGPSWRMVVSLEKTGVRSWATYPGGQSGNPGSKHYADMLDRWSSGKYFPMVFMKDPEAAKERTLQSLQFNPQQK
ncbi:penicillin acylase family protein [Fulvivirgaceae bacterium PWU4]|uniref:Penicillin acylase family protein n=1 Tax=Chryseosolibacter histidini TaxID=2782349 RepID=A0AAP2DS44_9BACT|nr:penicillin acylase family protein [Chryseosolibacter histidini]MBT1701463.1 penicillin acylase family protein [Chryseosolibacter histidini]